MSSSCTPAKASQAGVGPGVAWGGLEKRSLGEGDAEHCVLFNRLGIIQRLGVDFLPWDSKGQDVALHPQLTDENSDAKEA